MTYQIFNKFLQNHISSALFVLTLLLGSTSYSITKFATAGEVEDLRGTVEKLKIAVKQDFLDVRISSIRDQLFEIELRLKQLGEQGQTPDVILIRRQKDLKYELVDLLEQKTILRSKSDE